jgi:molybdenum cofactor cytidylyltransferase
MGAGGLLKEITTRGLPREAKPSSGAPRMPKIAAIVLAAGRSTRMRGRNKLLLTVRGKPMVAHAVDALLASGAAAPVIVVTGHDSTAVGAALAGRNVRFVNNPDHAEGLSTSLRTGIAAVPADCDGALVCLGDMPLIQPAHLDRLISAFNPVEGRVICVPTHEGKRGNPVLWGAQLFAEMRALAGDVGARHLIGEHADLVREVPVADDSVLTDFDTPEAFAGLTQ